MKLGPVGPLASLNLTASLVLLLGIGGTPVAAAAAATAAAPPFSVAVDQDPATGWRLVTLRHDNPRDPGLSLQARVAAEAGGNLFSFQVGGQELLLQPEKLADLAQQRTGMPIMFPTPNRVRDAKMTFEGRTFQFEPNNQNNFIHGLARRRPFQAGAPRADRRQASVVLTLDWDDRQPEWSRFPIKHQLTVTYALTATGLRVSYAVRNLDQQRLPYGFGLHPYFRLPDGAGSRKDVFFTVPLTQRMEALEMLPTGKLLPVAGTAHDLRRPTSIEGRTFDDVYLGMAPGKRARIELRNIGLELGLSGSKEFTHLVVFAPADRPVFSLENQTSSTDAHNLWAQGKKRESHLLIVAPGATGSGTVSWGVRRVTVRTR
jgi:aldose 1-epimerase